MPDTFTRDFEQTFSRLVGTGDLLVGDRERFEEIYRNNTHVKDDETWKLLAWLARNPGGPQPATAARPAPSTDRIAAMAAEFPPPPVSGDAEVRAVDAEVRAYAAQHGVDYWTALTRIGGRDYSDRSLPPVTTVPEDMKGVDQQSVDLDRRVRDAATQLEMGYMPAISVVRLDDALAAAQADDGSHELEWRDTSTSQPPPPYGAGVADAWERDQRRAKAAGVELSRPYWEQAAEDGQDLVYERAHAQRTARVAQARDQRDQHIVGGQADESNRRRIALEDELNRRARKRLEARPPGRR